LGLQTTTTDSVRFRIEQPSTLNCPHCHRQIAVKQIVRPRFDYVLCPHCRQEFVPQVFLL